ncbi:MAG: PAS domain-containing protein [Alphaproteobacteria bacterium]|nr:PAS domain-containing protein [Alphaproteobacteria bacterium]
MSRTAPRRQPNRRRTPVVVDPAQVLAALPSALLVVDAGLQVHYANPAAEQFFGYSATYLCKERLDSLTHFDSPLVSLATQVFRSGNVMSEYGVSLGSPRAAPRAVDVQVVPVSDPPAMVMISLLERSIAHKLDHQLTSLGAARSVAGLAAALAHEVRNPLSGIRGAAQLLEQDASDADRTLTRLIRDEADRINALVERMDLFADERPMERGPVNIHQVLEHVRRLAENGFARHVRFVEIYDPSLPPVYGNRDRLIQVFLNLIKNAAEAAPAEGAEIMLATAFQPGLRIAATGTRSRVALPLVVTVRDNGEGIPEDLKRHLFEPFITTKRDGSGLGLSLVAKYVGDHGGLIEFESEPRRTQFKVMLPIHDGQDDTR